MFSNIFKDKTNKFVLLVLCATMVLMSAVSLISNTLAQASPITVVLESPTGYVEAEVGESFVIRANGVTSWVSSNTSIATVSDLTNTTVTITGHRVGSVNIMATDPFGSVLTYPRHFVDSDNITQYTLTSGDEGYFSRSGDNAPIGIETVPSQARDSITWSSRNQDIATVDDKGVITARTNRGVTMIIGDFIDKWGQNQMITYFVIIDSSNADLLEELLDIAKELQEDDYTPDSWRDSDIEQVIRDVEDLLDGSHLTEDKIKDAIDKIKDAINDLVEKSDNSKLQDALEAAKELEEDNYTPDSWKDSNIEQAIKDAEDVVNNPNATEDEINQAIEDLENAINDLVEKVDRTELGNLIDAAKELEEEDFTPDSWSDSNIEQAIIDAEAVLKNPNATEDEINKAIEDLENAINNLVEKADKSALESVLEMANELEEEDYKPDSWRDSNIEQAIKDAEAVLDNPNATDEEVEQAIEDLINAIESLEEKVNKTGLSDKLAEAKNLLEADHTPISWENSDIEQVIKDAEVLLEDPNATEEQVDDAIKALEDAMNALVLRADKSGLLSSLINANLLVRDQFTPNSWDEMSELLREANAVFTDLNATQQEVDAVKEALDNALTNLVPMANKNALVTAIATANSKEQVDYTESGWEAVADALKVANAINLDPNVSQQEVDEAVGNLQSAINNLVFIGDLNDAIDMAENLNESNYTPSGWQSIQEALQVAKEVQSNPNATQEEVDEAESSLRDTTANAQTAGNKGALNAAIQLAERESEEDYKTDSWNTFYDALEAARVVEKEEEATQAEIDNATNTLLTAMGALERRANLSELQMAINNANSKLETEYSTGSWNRIEAALRVAEDVMEEPDVSQEEVDAARDALNNAINDLVYIAELAQAVSGASLIDATRLTPESREIFLNALNNAREVLANGDATQAQVDEALAQLNDAINKNEPQPAFIDQVKNLGVGSTFDADGYRWRIIRKDADGHALVVTEFLHTTTQYNPTPINYNDSLLNSRMNQFYDENLDIMKQYATGVSYDEIYATAITNTNDITRVDKEKEPTAFALGLGDINSSTALNSDAKRKARVNNASGSFQWYWIRTGVNSNRQRHMNICYAGIRYFTQANSTITREWYLRPAVMIDLNK